VAEDGETVKPVAAAHTDPRKSAEANALLRRDLPDPYVPPGVVQVLHTGLSAFFREPSTASYAALARDADQIELVRSLGVSSAMIVPLAARGRALGVITLVVSAESDRVYTAPDLYLAEELARRAALLVDNARLFSEAQQLNADLEERVVQRTADLQAAVGQLRNSRVQLLLLARHEQLRREEDRARMAREVHDELGQALTGIKMDLAWLQKHTGSEQKGLLRKYRDMSELVDTTIQSVRRIATELRLGILDDLGLVPAMEWQAQDFEQRSGIRCTFTSSLEKVALGAGETSALYRILQEALTNVARHASATRVDVSLEEEQDCVCLRIQDNGRGVTEGEVNGPESFGLLGMRERALLYSGDFSIQGTPGQGTTVAIRLPLDRGRRRNDQSAHR
jgi:signal transduction histidine kinase